jgi:hypothetical protein
MMVMVASHRIASHRAAWHGMARPDRQDPRPAHTYIQARGCRRPSPLLHTSEIARQRANGGEHRGIAHPRGGPEPCNARYRPSNDNLLQFTRASDRKSRCGGCLVVLCCEERERELKPTLPLSDLQLPVVLAQTDQHASFRTPPSHLSLFSSSHAPPQLN